MRKVGQSPTPVVHFRLTPIGGPRYIGFDCGANGFKEPGSKLGISVHSPRLALKKPVDLRAKIRDVYPMADTPILNITGLTKEYGPVRAVDHISFSLRAGEIIGLLGPNGAGKSTTINMILGILKPTGGTVEVFGLDMATHRSAISRDTNFAAVYAHMPLNLTVRQNLRIFGLLYGVKHLSNRITALLDQFDLKQFADTKAGLLSSGELSRLNLAKAVMNSPRLLLLDEPTASLDPSVSRLIRETIKQYALDNRTAVLWTSHNMKEIEAVCDSVMFLSKGKILLSGNPRTLASEYGKNDLEELFITIAREPLSLQE
jgi:ABC-2 type transport system ATP-binding protein